MRLAWRGRKALLLCHARDRQTDDVGAVDPQLGGEPGKLSSLHGTEADDRCLHGRHDVYHRGQKRYRRGIGQVSGHTTLVM